MTALLSVSVVLGPGWGTCLKAQTGEASRLLVSHHTGQEVAGDLLGVPVGLWVRCKEEIGYVPQCLWCLSTLSLGLAGLLQRRLVGGGPVV